MTFEDLRQPLELSLNNMPIDKEKQCAKMEKGTLLLVGVRVRLKFRMCQLCQRVWQRRRAAFELIALHPAPHVLTIVKNVAWRVV